MELNTLTSVHERPETTYRVNEGESAVMRRVLWEGGRSSHFVDERLHGVSAR